MMLFEEYVPASHGALETDALGVADVEAIQHLILTWGSNG